MLKVAINKKISKYICFVQEIFRNPFLSRQPCQGILKALGKMIFFCYLHLSTCKYFSKTQELAFPFQLQSPRAWCELHWATCWITSLVFLKYTLNSMYIYLFWSRLLMALNSRSGTFLIESLWSCVSFLLPWNIVATKSSG